MGQAGVGKQVVSKQPTKHPTIQPRNKASNQAGRQASKQATKAPGQDSKKKKTFCPTKVFFPLLS